ncbi:hypothetical protein ACSBR2_034883 [Camellia fascicularis]
MFTEFQHIIPFLAMSNPELLILKEDKKQIEFPVSSIPTLKFPDGSQITTSNLDHLHHHQEQEQEEKCESTASSETLKPPCLGQSDDDDDDDDDGFRTPTSLDHKIPVITQCPPAPKKLRQRPSTKKRKALFRDDELMFPSKPFGEDFERKIKRSRRMTRDYNSE